MGNILPPALISSLRKVSGFDEDAFLKVHDDNKPVTSVRFNPFKKTTPDRSGLPLAENVSWSTNGYYLEHRPSFTTDPFFHAGAYYVQEASSMFLEQAISQSLDLNQSIKVLDLCAAPGGKSTLIQSFISENSLLVSNEVIKTRVSILTENITKSGAANVIVTNNDPSDFKKLNSFFDLIVVDAPCSGSGLFRKDPAAINEWSPESVNLCSHRQQRILADIIPSLKPGGILIYSTCSYSREENEFIADWLIENHDLQSNQLRIESEWNIIETVSENNKAFGYRFYPDKLKGEGFFISVFKKHDDEVSVKDNHSKNKNELISKSEIETVRPWLSKTNNIAFLKWKESVLAFPADLLKDLFLLQSTLYIKKAGINIGEIIRQDLIPSHELAMSHIMSDDIPSVELEYEDALQFLRHQPMNKNIETQGWVLLEYKGLSLGFVKSMPNRVNNYYPKEWRILNK